MSAPPDSVPPDGVPEYRPNPLGEFWHPEERASPHIYDYKFNIGDPPALKELLDLIAAERALPGSQRLSLEWLRQRGRTVRYLDSAIKRGCFIQAGCIVTDGFGSGDVSHVLLNERSSTQFHDPAIPRRTKGLAAIFGTVLASFQHQDPFGHAPTALFNDLRDHSPWALFSRKLLMPDIHVDSRFLGLTYNFSDPDCRYVFLVWHVRTQNRLPALVVPARQAKKHDLPGWHPARSVVPDTLGDKPMDRLALGAALGINLNRTTPDPERHGFLAWPKFEETWKPRRHLSAVVVRETVILDLLRLYQQEFHGGRRQLSAPPAGRLKERALQHDLLQFLNDWFDRRGLPGRAYAEPTLGWKAGAGRSDVAIEILDHNPPARAEIAGVPPRPAVVHYRYLVECKLSDTLSSEPEYLAQCREYQAAIERIDDSRRREDGFHAIVLLHGLRGPHHRFPLQTPEAYPHFTVPIHVIRVALTPERPSAATPSREVAHGIIPLRTRDGGVRWFLFTHQKKDAGPRLPGGKLECGETPEQALRRELKEELRLLPEHYADLVPIKPGNERNVAGFAVTDVSMKDGEEHLYQIYPFVVILNSAGRNHILASYDKGDHRPRRASIENWIDGAFGHGPGYANSVMENLTPELMAEAALDIDSLL